MCTVTYIPLEKNRVMFSSNRDVPASRSPDHLSSAILGESLVCYPEDRKAGGTWLAADDKGRYGCLLNGAFHGHRPKGPYRMSRGKMVLDFFRYQTGPEFISLFEFEGMEPFTFIIFDGQDFIEIRWDEKKLHQKELDRQKAHIWSSSTLYSPEIRELRKTWLDDLLSGSSPSVKDVQNFHREVHLDDPENDIVMQRGDLVQTVSISHLDINENRIRFDYEDLVSGTRDLRTIHLSDGEKK